MRVVCAAILSLLLVPSLGQKESQKLKNKQRELQKKINYTKQLIGDTKNKERLTLTELGIINQQIAYRNELVALYGHQVSRLEERISDNRELIESLEKDLLTLKDKYAKMIFFAYKHRHSDESSLLMLMSGEDVNRALLRMKYLNQMADYRKVQVEFIKQTQADLMDKQAELARDIEEKRRLVSRKDEEKRKYEDDKSSQRDILVQLKQEEVKLKAQLDDQEERKRKLSRAIRRAIEEEIAAQSRKNNTPGFESTPESRLAGKNFAANKGRLPWPVAKGEITGKFGKQPHPVIKGVFTQNNGVDISTARRANMRAVFAGKVTSVFVIPGAGKAVMVSHGTYRSVYANLQEVFVKKGDKVEAKQDIGNLLPGDNGELSEAHFEIWKVSGTNMSKENPSYWLAR